MMGTLDLLTGAQFVFQASNTPFLGGIAPACLSLTSAKHIHPKGCAGPAGGSRDEA